MYSNKAEFDKFYTKKEIAKYCIESIDMSRYDLVIEPSAGSGSFFNQIEHPNKVGIDLQPETDYLLQMSWLDYLVPKEYKEVLVIGNPPFGKRNHLSKQFVKHAALFPNVTTIAFILPDVYNKHTLQKIFPVEYKLATILKLPLNSFEANGVDYNIPCSFFVFDKHSNVDLRFDPKKYTETTDWVFSDESNYDFFVMGAAINTIKDVPEETNRGYFIKVKQSEKISLVRNKFKKLSTKGNSSASGGVYWMTKPELVKCYIEHYEKETKDG